MSLKTHYAEINENILKELKLRESIEKKMCFLQLYDYVQNSKNWLGSVKKLHSLFKVRQE